MNKFWIILTSMFFSLLVFSTSEDTFHTDLINCVSHLLFQTNNHAES